MNFVKKTGPVAPGMGVLLAALLAASCSGPPGEKEFARGVRELERGNPVRAKALFEASISRRPAHPDNALAYNYAGMADARLGQDADARKAFEESRRLNPLRVEPVYNLGVLAGRRGDLRSAQRFLNEAIAMNREDTTALEYLAHLYMVHGQTDRARNALEAARDRNPASSRILTSLAGVHLREGRAEDAVESLMSALEKNPDYAPALYNLGVVYDAYLAEPEQAKAYYRKFLAHADPDSPVDAAREAMGRLAEGGSSARPAFAAAPEASAAPTPEAVDPIPVAASPSEPVIAPPPPPEETPVPTAWEGRLADAARLAEQGRSEQALAAFLAAADHADEAGIEGGREQALRQAASACFDLPDAHAALAEWLEQQGRLDEAGAVYRRALSIAPGHVRSLTGQGRIAILRGEYDAALVTLREAVAQDATALEPLWELARLFDRHMELPESAARSYRSFAASFPQDRRSREALNRAQQLAPLSTPAIRTSSASPAAHATLPYRPPAQVNRRAADQAFRRAFAFQREQNWDQAVFFYLRSLENDDQTANTFYNLGICYMMQGNPDLAAAAYREALRVNPGLSAARFNLALLYQRSGDVDQARALLDALLREEPDYAQAHYALGVLLADQPGERNQAAVHYRRFLELAPNDRSAPAVRRWLEANR